MAPRRHLTARRVRRDADPFVVNARFGLLGMSFNDDANRHLPAIEALRIAGEVPSSVFGISYRPRRTR